MTLPQSPGEGSLGQHFSPKLLTHGWLGSEQKAVATVCPRDTHRVLCKPPISFIAGKD